MRRARKIASSSGPDQPPNESQLLVRIDVIPTILQINESSVTSNYIAPSGYKTFNVGTGKAFVAGMKVTAFRSVDDTIWMHGTVISYTGSSLVVAMDSCQGTGTYSGWYIISDTPINDKVGGDNNLIRISGTSIHPDDSDTFTVRYTAAVAAIIPSMFSGTTPLVKTWAFIKGLHDGVKIFINKRVLIYSDYLTSTNAILANRYVGGGVSSLTFTTVGYSAGWTAPSITAATLSDANVTWTRPDFTTFTGKAPAMTNFSQLGIYKCYVSDWSKVTSFSFYAGSAQSWVSRINLKTIFPKMTGLLSCTLRDQSALVENVTLWQLPQSMTNLSYFLYGCTGLTGVITNWILPTGATNIDSFLAKCTGLTGVITNWILPTGATDIGSFLLNCTGLTGVITNWILPTGATNLSYFLYGCTGLTGVFPTPTALTVCTTYQEIIRNTTSISGDVSTWTWRTNIANASIPSTRLTYGVGGSLQTNVKNGLTFNMNACNLTQAMVDAILVDLAISAATGLIINIAGSGNAAPSAAGVTAKALIVGMGGVVTTN